MLISKLLSKLSLLICLLGFTQNLMAQSNKYYQNAWKKVDSLERKQLPKSVLETVADIYQKAKNEKAHGHFVKAIIYRIKYLNQVEEDALAKSIEELRLEAEKAEYPIRPLLHSMTAEIYWQYYSANRYKFYDRTSVVDFDLKDIRTWDLEKLVEQVLKQHLASLEKPELAQKESIEIFDEVITKGYSTSRELRPTLYDFIAHRAVNFLMSTEPDITQPSYQFSLNDPDYLKTASEFVDMTIESKDSLSFKFYAIQVLQDLLQFHQKDSNPSAKIAVDLKRLDFVYNNLTASNADSLYLEALENLQKTAEQYPISAQINYRIAKLYNDKSYNPLQSDKNKWAKKTALEICQKAIKKFPNSDGAVNCRSILKSIRAKSIKILTENTVPSNQHTRVRVEYRNVPKTYWKIVKTSKDKIAELSNKRYYNDQLIDYYKKQKTVQEWEVAFPDDGDYQQHSVEEKIPNLPLGMYVVLASNNKDFLYKNNAVAYTYLSVSDLAYLSKNDKINEKTELFVVNRTSGEAEADVKAEVYQRKYNYSKKEYEQILQGTYQSDKNGYLSIPYFKDTRNFYIKFTKAQDELYSIAAASFYGNFHQQRQSKPKIYEQAFVFLDRGIYRPGQTVYFKSIVLESDNIKNSTLKTEHEVTAYLSDVNSQKVAKLQLTTNEYGTVSGKFTLPNTGLNGQMRLDIFKGHLGNSKEHTVKQGETLYKIARKYNVSLGELKKQNNLNTNKVEVGKTLKVPPARYNYRDRLGSINFSMEDYKRPKFEVSFKPIEGTFRLDENIKAQGQAKAYSGANITDADVKYRVVRRATFPSWWYYYWGYYPSSPEMEITNGTTQTDKDGNFEIDFTAIPDPDVDKKSSPTFTYTVYADVTDINGETHSSQTYVRVAYKALSIGISGLSSRQEKAELDSLGIITNNLAGQFEPAKGKIVIHKLQAPEKVYRDRLWSRTDKFNYTEEEWAKLFPHDVYDKELDKRTWKKQKEVLSTSFDTQKSKTLALSRTKNWQSGQYVLEMTAKDKYGEEVKHVEYFELYSKEDKKPNIPEMLVYQGIKTYGEPGETAKVLLGSSAKVRALYEVGFNDKVISRQWVNLNNEQRTFSIPIQEAYRGNFGLNYTFVKYNRLYQQSATVVVPYTNKELDISFETYRNKLQPGEEETWKIRIKGKKGEKVASEMVATLYDASLDTFKPNYWNFNIYSTFYHTAWSGKVASTSNFKVYQDDWNDYASTISRDFDRLNWFGYYPYYNQYARNQRAIAGSVSGVSVPSAVSEEVLELEEDTALMVENEKSLDLDKVDEPSLEKKAVDRTRREVSKEEDGQEEAEDLAGVKARTNFNETAFFYPHLKTDENGDILIEFTIPEALTKWKMLGFAHTKDLKFGLTQNELVTQKELMVVPNAPRFFRESDKMAFPSKVSNISDKDLKGTAQLFLFDALTNKPIDKDLGNTNAKQNIEIKAGQSIALDWNINIPDGIQAITYKVVAKAGKFSDGEEMTLPVLTNSMLVTETMPLPIRSNQTKVYTMDKLLTSNTSSTLRHQNLTLEFTSNPAWYAIQALPYLMEFPHECAEQIFSRFYANSIATHVANSSPKIKEVFNTWKSTPELNSLVSNLDKNQELKSIILEETPWVLQANDEAERKRRLGLLFDLNRMSNELQKALNKLTEKQTSSGAWTWFEGMPEDRYITQHIITGMGHLDNLKVKTVRSDKKAWNMTQKGVAYLDGEVYEDYERLKRLAKRGKIKLKDNHLSYLQIQYLYSRSYFMDLPVPPKSKEAFDYFKGQAQKYWTSYNRYMQGMITLALHRYKDAKTPTDIIKSLKERALQNEEMGMYWKDNYGYYWYQAPIESQALMIEVFDEVANDTQAVDGLKTWLLKQKQTTDWKTTKATAEACYALLLRGANWLSSDKLVEISVGNKKINPFDESNPLPVEAGTGYFKTSWKGEDIKASMGKVTVSKKDEGVAWGALYWQYFEQLDKITTAETPLKLKKQLFREDNSDRGKVLKPLAGNTKLKVGDVVKVRVELSVDRNMEYVHMKDMRASGFEPMNTLSQYKYQDGLGYYESTRDAATHFFFGYLPKGTYVFEYPLRVSHEGDFSNGITTIQCMYAPEFSSHSEGARVKVEEK